MADKPVLKQGYKTTEFWLTIAAWVVGLLLDSGVIAPDGFVHQGLGTLSAGLMTAGYSYSRGKLKEVLDKGKVGYKTTEFWLTVIALAVGGLVAAGFVADDSILDKSLNLVGSALAGLGYVVARGLTKKPNPPEVK